MNETVTGEVYRYGWKNGEIVGPRLPFGNVIRTDATPCFKGPDGMAFSRLFIAVFGGDVILLNANGVGCDRLETAGKLPTNVAFGLPGLRRIHVKEYELGQIETFDVEIDGLPLWSEAEAKSKGSP